MFPHDHDALSVCSRKAGKGFISEKDEDIAERVRDVDDKLSKLLARIDSKQKVQNNPELSPANIENSNGNAQFPEKISISPESEAESGFSSRDSNQTQINDGWNLFVLREMALKHSLTFF